jgi:hypothetical protein
MARTPKEQTRFWYVHATDLCQPVSLAVAAFTEVQARRQARKRVGKGVAITEVSAVEYPHAWVMNHGWRPRVTR